jgi:5-epi-alpha-selinene synthase
MQVEERCDLLEVPKIEDPFPVEAGPHADEAQRKHVQWAEEHGVFRSEGERKRFGAMDIGALANLLYPEASSPEDVQLVADWCAWLLLRDDRWDDTEDSKEWELLAGRDRAYLRLMRQAPWRTPGWTLASGTFADDNLYGALADLCMRLRKRALQEDVPDPVDRRLVGVMKGFFFASVQETAYQHRGDYPTVSEYVKMRSVTGGLDILTFVLAALDGIRLPKGLLADPAVRRLTDASHNVCCWHNDLVSLNKEISSGEVHNLILVLQNDPEYGCQSLRGALGAAVTMIHEELGTFIELEREIRAMGGPWARPAEWYARMLRHRVSGVIEWQEACAARYQEALAASNLGY